MTVAVPVIL